MQIHLCLQQHIMFNIYKGLFPVIYLLKENFWVGNVYHWSPNIWLYQAVLSKLSNATFKKLSLECPLTFPENHSSPLGVLFMKD